MTGKTMNSGQAQVISPILTTQARGYTNSEFVGLSLLPWADIPNRSMKVINFGKDAFRKYMKTRRAPGGSIPRLNFGYASDPVSLYQEALAGTVPVETAEDANRVPGIDVAAVAVQGVQDIIALGREAQIAAQVLDPANYNANNKLALAGTDKWTDPASDPLSDVTAGREAIRRMIGRYPNVMELSATALNACKNHPTIKGQFKYTSSQSITTDMLAGYFEVAEIIVGAAVYLPDGADDDAPGLDVWGNDVVLAYVPKGGQYRVPAFGYTYRLSGYPMVEQPWYDPDTRSWVYPTFEEFRPYLVGAEGGFLIQGAGG